MKVVEVVAAVIENNDEIFCAQRNNNNLDYLAYKYEFPGGKVEVGETNEEALIREIKEELNYTISIDRFLMTVDHQYPDFKLIMHVYACTAGERDFTLKEHVNGVWLKNDQLPILDWAEADIPIVNYILNK